MGRDARYEWKKSDTIGFCGLILAVVLAAWLYTSPAATPEPVSTVVVEKKLPLDVKVISSIRFVSGDQTAEVTTFKINDHEVCYASSSNGQTKTECSVLGLDSELTTTKPIKTKVTK